MTQLQKLVKVMAKLKKCGITFDSKIRFMCQFSSLDNDQIVLDALINLSYNFLYSRDVVAINLGGYNNVKEIHFPVIVDIYQVSRFLQVSDKLGYIFTYRIYCRKCNRIVNVDINCSYGSIPKYCDDCQGNLHDQGS